MGAMRTNGPATALLGTSLCFWAACSTAARPSAQSGPSDVVVTVGGVSITLEQIDAKALRDPASNFGDMTLEQAMYQARRAAADEMIANILLDQEAKRRNVARTALIQQEIASKTKPVTEEDIAQWYQANPQQVQGATLDRVHGPILSLLTQMRTQDARDAYIDTLKAKTRVRIVLEPPRAAVKAGNSPAKGPANAPIELIEFADFQCPYCLAVSPTLKKVLDTYGDRIRFVYRNFPLDNHPNAVPAAEAAQCANEQGQFWPYHDRLFGTPGKLSDAELKQTAAALGLDPTRFNKCLDQHKYRSIVDADRKAGTEAGVTGTPAFFINGRLLSGAEPFDAFKHVIDEELEIRKP
jgi:protein-disulfide isomerase